MTNENFTPKKKTKTQKTYTIESKQDKQIKAFAKLWELSESEALRNIIDQGVFNLEQQHGIKVEVL